MSDSPKTASNTRWNIGHHPVANAAVSILLASLHDPALLRPPVNVLRRSLHPTGLAPAIAKLPMWRTHLLGRLRREANVSGDPVLMAMIYEPSEFGGHEPKREAAIDGRVIAVPLAVETQVGRLSLISTTKVFGTPTERAVAELTVETFYLADAVTTSRLVELQASSLTDSVEPAPVA